MKYKFISILLGSALLSACGGVDAPNAETKAKTPAAKPLSSHMFSEPYECSRLETKTSKRTGKDMTLKSVSYYSPQKGWRIDLAAVGSGTGFHAANLYTPQARYDGVYREVDDAVTGVEFKTAWPNKVEKPNVAISNLSKYKKKDCRVLDNPSVFEISDLDTLEVMGQ